MTEVLKDVLIKQCGGSLHDKIFIVDNLPKTMLFEETVRMVQRVDRDGYMDGTLAIDPDNEMHWTLYPGVEFSQNGDGGIVFWMEDEKSRDRLKDIDRYIDGTLPRDTRIPKRVFNAITVGDAMSGPLPVSQIPRVPLPMPEDGVVVPIPSVAKIKNVRGQRALPVAIPVRQEEEEPVRLTKRAAGVKKGWSPQRREEARQRMIKRFKAKEAAAA